MGDPGRIEFDDIGVIGVLGREFRFGCDVGVIDHRLD
jgi:hypothetical protein